MELTECTRCNEIYNLQELVCPKCKTINRYKKGQYIIKDKDLEKFEKTKDI